jgi:hypothetical protein
MASFAARNLFLLKNSALNLTEVVWGGSHTTELTTPMYFN